MEFEPSWFASLLLRFSTPERHGFRAFALLGATRAKGTTRFSAAWPDDRKDITESDFTYGAGVERKVGSHLSLGLEWVRYLDASDQHHEGICGTARYRF